MTEQRPLILISNDDGITAPGLRVLVEEMSQIGEVIVVAPDKWLFSDKPASEHQTIYRQDMIVIERAIEIN